MAAPIAALASPIAAVAGGIAAVRSTEKAKRNIQKARVVGVILDGVRAKLAKIFPVFNTYLSSSWRRAQAVRFNQKMRPSMPRLKFQSREFLPRFAACDMRHATCDMNHADIE
jgi:hypothetical protein